MGLERGRIMERRTFIQTTGGIVGLGLLGAQPALANPPGALVNAEVTSSGAVVATDDNFVISDQEISVDGGTFYEDGGDSYVIYNNGYSGKISGNTLTVSAVNNTTFGIHAAGGDVKVTDNTISADDDVGNQFLAVGFTGGATGNVKENEITGAHRVAVLDRGAGTDVAISKNTIIGPGPRSTGWADNGIQIDSGATGQVKDNTIDDHWYTPNTFNSAGLLAFSDDVVVQRNHFGDNDLGIAFFGDRNNVIHNTVEVTTETTDTSHYGVYEVGGTDNGIRQNTVTTEATANGLVGIIVLGDNAKLIRNDLDGWEDLLLDAGDGTKLPKPFDPDA
jgi:hypothetical protein